MDQSEQTEISIQMKLNKDDDFYFLRISNIVI